MIHDTLNKLNAAFAIVVEDVTIAVPDIANAVNPLFGPVAESAVRVHEYEDWRIIAVESFRDDRDDSLQMTFMEATLGLGAEKLQKRSHHVELRVGARNLGNEDDRFVRVQTLDNFMVLRQVSSQKLDPIDTNVEKGGLGPFF